MQRTPVQQEAGGTGLDFSPDLTVLGIFWSVFLDIQAALGDDSPDAAKVAAIDGYIRERVPGRLPALSPGVSPDAVAGLIAAQLARGVTPATGIFAGLTGRDIRLDVIGPHMRPGQGDELKLLRLRAEDQVYVREGYLMAGTVQCAKVSLRLVPDRVSDQASAFAWNQVWGGAPVGKVLAPYGLNPGYRKVEVFPGGNPAVRTRRVLRLGVLPAGIATEEVPDNFCIRLACRA